LQKQPLTACQQPGWKWSVFYIFVDASYRFADGQYRFAKAKNIFANAANRSAKTDRTLVTWSSLFVKAMGPLADAENLFAEALCRSAKPNFLFANATHRSAKVFCQVAEVIFLSAETLRYRLMPLSFSISPSD
jgi:hypothetical protein